MLSRLPTALLSLLIAASHTLAAPSIPISYDFTDNYKPAPLPEDGPPASFYASRNKNLLPAQICGVVGGYVVTVLIWGILLLTVGRRMKRKTQTSPKTLELELVSARPVAHTVASPSSARSATSWFKKGFKTKSEAVDSVANSPQSPVLASPTSFDQKVLDADRTKAQAEMERLYAAVMDHDKKKSYSQVSTDETELNASSRRPSAINTMRESGNYSNPNSPIRAIYPPHYHSGAPSAPLPRERIRDQPPSSPRSILSKKSHLSTNSTTSSKHRFNLKNLRISGPVQKYPGELPQDEGRKPLSPRFYNPGAPPSPPTQQNSPITPGDQELEYEQMDEVQPLPRPAPQRIGSYPTIQIQPVGSAPRSAASSNQSLPLRGFAEPLKSPDLRTTVLDRRLDKLSLMTPKTGVPYTPYSPYMPFTPLTPVTPHLVTKKERKARDKMSGRKMKDTDDLVRDPKDMFGDAY
jgi:hypothetical protein